MTVFVCEDCADGIFTGVYDAWASRLGHANVALRIEGPADLELFVSYRKVETDGEKARKVADTIRRRMGAESYEMIYRAALANAPEKADSIYRVLAVGLSSHTDSWTARHLLERLQDADACRILELSRKVWNEVHRYEGFVRFRELAGGILFSEIDAENQVLPLLGEHFSDRFPNENFLIFDHHSGDCLVHAARRQWFIWKRAGEELLEMFEKGKMFADQAEECGKQRSVDAKREGISANRTEKRKGRKASNAEGKELSANRTEERGNQKAADAEGKELSANRTEERGGRKVVDTKQKELSAELFSGMPEERGRILPGTGTGKNGGIYPGVSRTADSDLKTADEEEIQRLWRGFCESISIRERENLRLQMQFWPLKFRKWMTEGTDQKDGQ